LFFDSFVVLPFRGIGVLLLLGWSECPPSTPVWRFRRLAAE
jgi:hypothetical protein